MHENGVLFKETYGKDGNLNENKSIYRRKRGNDRITD